jgi:REP element-mobilizing transposase RayT
MTEPPVATCPKFVPPHERLARLANPSMFYRRTLPHLQRNSKPHFITFVTDRRTILPDCVRDIVLASCLHDRGSRYELHAAVVMPDHVHLILTPLNDMTRMQVWALPETLDAIKGASAHKINRRIGKRGPVWQDESFDHVLRSSESLDRKIDYVLENPVRSGLVSRARDYRWLWCSRAFLLVER